MFEQSRFGCSKGKQRISGGFKQGNMNAFKFGNSRRKRKLVKRGK